MSEETKTPESDVSDFEKQLQAYREKLLTGATAQQGEHDKAVMTLSGGALGLSIGLLKDIFGRATVTATGLLLTAWIFWGVSLAATLYSYYSSAEAFRQALKRLDDRTAYLQKQSRWVTATKLLNAASGILFLLGLISLIAFLSFNPIHTPPPQPPNPAAQQTTTPKTP